MSPADVVASVVCAATPVSVSTVARPPPLTDVVVETLLKVPNPVVLPDIVVDVETVLLPLADTVDVVVTEAIYLYLTQGIRYLFTEAAEVREVFTTTTKCRRHQ